MALILVGSISILLCLTKNPGNLPDVTPNARTFERVHLELMFPKSIIYI